ncbi:MAG: hypothetical protein A2147_02280, partial [Chloroflexi bacterium RBG_16_57_8]
MAETIGFIGLGVMGAPMARHLAEKYETVVFDIDHAKAESVIKAREAKDVNEVGRLATTILLSLPTSEIVQDVVLGKNGLIHSMKTGRVIIDTSTTSPVMSQEIARALEGAGVSFLDAPISGGEKAAIEGTLSIMVGGKEEVFKQSLEILKAIGTTVVRMGESGMGGVTKLVNNLIVGITFVAVAEGFALGVKSGLDPNVLYEAIRNGWAGSKGLDVSAEAMLNRNF